MIVLFDGNSLSKRVFHILENNFDKDDFQRIFVSKVLNTAAYLKGQYLIVAFSDQENSKRKEENHTYPFNNDENMDFTSLEKLLIDGLARKGVFSVLVQGYESRDIISTLQKKITKVDRKCCIATADKPLFSLIDSNTSIYDPMPKNNKGIINKEVFLTQYGFEPELFKGYLTLTGLKKYGLKGITGVGDKRAKELINEYKTIDNLTNSSQEIRGKLGQSLRMELPEMAEISSQVIDMYHELSLGFNLSQSKFIP